MRIWDIHPGYLNRQSLLGEHCELHGLVLVLVNKKKGYEDHPEVVRWLDHGWALKKRHQLLAAEMSLRNYKDRTPVTLSSGEGTWPEGYVDKPFQQFRILEERYRTREQGRIPLPKNAQQLWSQHKYSVMARDVNLYKKLGPEVAQMKPGDDFSDLATTTAELLRTSPSAGSLRNALQHMWGYVSEVSAIPSDFDSWSLSRLLQETQQRCLAAQEPYLTASTALSELQVWMEVSDP